ncbi:MAG: GCN5-related N-acetyltransferase [uncultured bacterium]|nr:MAG: GCN5-related N-acetyltransferase [uncultured bacterium]
MIIFWHCLQTSKRNSKKGKGQKVNDLVGKVFLKSFIFKDTQCSFVELPPATHGKTILEFFQNNSDYFKLCEGREPNQACLDDFFNDAPDNFVSKKKSWGCFADHQLKAVIDYIEDYPETKTVFGGLLLIDQAWRGQGFGRRIMQIFRETLMQQGFEKMRIAVLEQNTNALKVWERAGFKEVSPRKKKIFGNLESVVVIMDLSL